MKNANSNDYTIIWYKRPASFVLLLLIRMYQATFSHWLGRQCRFMPTCSEYFAQSVVKNGFWTGSAKGIWRICRCNPFSKGGWDPPV